MLTPELFWQLVVVHKSMRAHALGVFHVKTLTCFGAQTGLFGLAEL